MGISAGRGECSVNIPETDPEKVTTTESETDLLVVGSGIAGLFAAVKAHDASARVLMVSTGRLGSSGMAIHKSEGLVPINDKGASTIPGLYAAGDALGSYMAGAIYTQVGSSLAGSAVQGAIVSEAAARYCEGVELPKLSTLSSFSKVLAPGLRVGRVVYGRFQDSIKRLKLNRSLVLPTLNQALVASCLKEGTFHRHLRKLRKTLNCSTVILRRPQPGISLKRPR